MKKAQTLLEYILIMILLMMLTVMFVSNFDFDSIRQGATFGIKDSNKTVIPPMTN